MTDPQILDALPILVIVAALVLMPATWLFRLH